MNPYPRLSIKTALLLFALASLLPIITLSGTALYLVQHAEGRRLEHLVLSGAKETASAIDRELRGMLGALQTLALTDTESIAASAAFYAQASRVGEMLGSNIILFESSTGRQLLNTRVPHGANLPQGFDQLALRAAKAKAPVVSGVVIGQVARRPVFGVWVPVMRDGATAFVIASAYEPARLSGVLRESVSTRGWSAVAIDLSGNIMAQSTNQEGFVGKPAPAWLLAFLSTRERVNWDAKDLESAPALAGTAVSDVAGWQIAVFVSRTVIDGRLLDQWILFGSGSLIAVIASLALTLAYARRIAWPMLQLSERAREVGLGDIPAPMNSPFTEANSVAKVLRLSAMKRKQHEDQIKLLLREVNHRSKNILAVVQAVAYQTANNDPKNFASTFSDRLEALAASHDLLVESEWRGVDLADLVRAEVMPFQDPVIHRIQLDGPALRVTPGAAQTIGMALHELSTNACKYGAWSSETGRVEVTWRLLECESARRLVMTWTESGGPAVTAPAHRGFGTTLIRDIVMTSLAATVELKYEAAGLTWIFDAPTAMVLNESSSIADEGRRCPTPPA